MRRIGRLALSSSLLGLTLAGAATTADAASNSTTSYQAQPQPSAGRPTTFPG